MLNLQKHIRNTTKIAKFGKYFTLMVIFFFLENEKYFCCFVFCSIYIPIYNGSKFQLINQITTSSFMFE